MDIGTAKPTAEQQALIPHHLIDIVPPDYNLSLAEYQDAAVRAIGDVQRRGAVPFLVGGSGQYLTAVEEGWSIPRVPPGSWSCAPSWSASPVNNRRPRCMSGCALVDPVAAKRIHPNNTRRVIRALEVQMLTGQAISDLQVKRPPPWRIRRLGLTLPRALLYPRVDARVDRMIEAGLVEEVAGLLELGYDRALPSMSGLGYLEIAAHLLDGTPLEEALERTKFSTHEFIRRQDVWFRGHDNGILWHNVEDIDAAALARNLGEWLERGD